MSLSMENRAHNFRYLFTKEQLIQIKSIFSMFVLCEDQIKEITETCERNMQYGCSRDPEIRKKTPLLMENTFIRRNLSGNGRSLERDQQDRLDGWVSLDNAGRMFCAMCSSLSPVSNHRLTIVTTGESNLVCVSLGVRVFVNKTNIC